MKNISNISEINIVQIQNKSLLSENEENNLLRRPLNSDFTSDLPCKYYIFI